MRVAPPPFSNPKSNLSWQEKMALAPLVVPTIIFTVGIVAGFKAATMPTVIFFALISSAFACAIITCLPIIQLRSRVAKAWRIVMVALLIVAVFCMGWGRAVWRMDQTALPRSQTMQLYRAVVTQVSAMERSIRMDLTIVDGALRGHKIKATMWRDPMMPMPQLASAIHATSEIEPIDLNSPSSITGFNYHQWIFSHGFSGVTHIRAHRWQMDSVRWNELPRMDAIRLRTSLWQHRLSEQLLSIDGDSGAMAIATAMTLGDKQAIPKELRQVYSTTGAGHLLALSGWHLGLIYFLLLLFLPTRRHKRVSLFVAVVAVWLFVLVVGMPVSAVRAALMLTVYALADVSSRGRQSLNTVAFAALLILIIEPASVYDVGFQMSVAAVVGIALLYKPLCAVVRARWFQSIAISLSAQIGVGPIVAYHFHTFSTYFLITNLVAMPIAMIGVYAAAAAIVLLPIKALSMFIALLSQSACACLNAVLRLISWLPGSCIRVERMTLFDVLLIYIALICFALAAIRLRRVAERRQRFRQLLSVGQPTSADKKNHHDIDPSFFAEEEA